ncbi:MAG: porin [Bradyrhizobiaceae bacterium]|nr:porin [Bradyrhizobiaceae bacterium]
MMGNRVAAASAAAVILGIAGGAFAADLNAMPTKAPVLKTDATCRSAVDFFTTGCQLAWYGVRFYGTIDIGFGYQSNGAPIDKFTSTGLTYLPQKMNNGAKWLFNQNAMSASNIGFDIKEPLGGGWSFIGQVEAAFDPASFDLTSGPGAIRDVIGRSLGSAPGVADSSVNGQFYNSLGFVGVSNATWGTLTFLRQKDLISDIFGSYDPIPGSNAFSLISGSGTYPGGGDTENVRATTAVKYRVNFANYRLGLFGQFGDYAAGNSAKGTFQGEVGADYHVGPGLLSLDAGGGYTKDAVSESIAIANTAAVPSTINGVGNPNAQITGLNATISDNTAATAVVKYTVDRLKLYAGYEWIQFAPPSDIPTGFTDIAGIQFGVPGFAITTATFNAKDKVLNVGWGGARYSITDAVDVAGAYYHVSQNNFTGSATTCAGATGNLAASACAGTQDTVSAVVDWKFAPKWDTYVGTQYTKLSGGLANGFIADNFLVTSAGVRFRW